MINKKGHEKKNTTPSLIVDDITVTYNNGHTAIYNTSFTLAGGTICALVGINGSGKSTLFKSIIGMVRPISGSIAIDHEPVSLALRKNRVAYVPQTEDVDWNFPVLVSDVVMMGRYGKMSFLRIPSEKDKSQVANALERVKLSHLAQRQIGELSGGQKKRVFLARALAQQAQIILLDEPFTGVDVQTEDTIIDLLKNLREDNHLILVSTHNLGSVPTFCDQVILINQTVLAAGATETTFTQANLEKTFAGILRHVNLSGEILHNDQDPRTVTILTDCERAAVFYGTDKEQPPHKE